MSSKTVTDTIVEELKKYGITPTVSHGTRHDHIKWQVPGQLPRMHIGSATANKHALTFIRSRADIRRMLRQDGVPLEAVLENEKKQIFQQALNAPVVIEQTPSKLERLERELEALVDFVFELRENISTMSVKARQEGRAEGIDMVLQVLKPAFEASLTTIETLKVNYSANELQDMRLNAVPTGNGHVKPPRASKRHPFDKNHPLLQHLTLNTPRQVDHIAKATNKTEAAIRQCLSKLRNKGLVENIHGQGYRLRME